MDLIKLEKEKKGIISNFLSDKLKENIKIIQFERLGEGKHGIAFKATTTNGKTFILKQFKTDGRNLEYFEDRVRESLLFQRTTKDIDNHVTIHDVVHLKENKLENISINEPIIIMEEIQGEEYFNKLSLIKEGKLTQTDIDLIEKIGFYLAKIHSKKGDEFSYKRYLKDWYANGILELCNEFEGIFSQKEILELKTSFLKAENELKSKANRCTKIHGEFFPGTIHFCEYNKLHTYDMRRIGEGEPADDLGSMLFNYYAFSLMSNQKLTKEFEQAAKILIESYQKKREDKEIFEFLPVFMAYRCLILAHPNLVPMDNETRIKFQKLLKSLLRFKKYEFSKMKKIIEEL